MTKNNEQIIEYPHCKDCSEYFICKRKGLNRYKPKFLNKLSCGSDCAYDYKCFSNEKPYECPYFREWCYEDMEVAKELGLKGCYKKTLPRINFNFSIQEIIEMGKNIWKKITNR